jgi:prokaryotic ubiquitin-like protein Pup
MAKEVGKENRELPRRARQVEIAEVPPGAIGEKRKKILKTIDDVIESIDKTLEENAEEFVRNFVQRGGE